jgi:anti-anti-sigma factor
MEFTQEKSAGGMVMSLRGSFTFKDYHSFRALLDALRNGGQHHVLDLSGLEFVDSAALGMLLIADDEARGAGWTLILRHPAERLARLMETAAMDSIFKIEW